MVVLLGGPEEGGYSVNIYLVYVCAFFNQMGKHIRILARSLKRVEDGSFLLAVFKIHRGVRRYEVVDYLDKPALTREHQGSPLILLLNSVHVGTRMQEYFDALLDVRSLVRAHMVLHNYEKRLVQLFLVYRASLVRIRGAFVSQSSRHTALNQLRKLLIVGILSCAFNHGIELALCGLPGLRAMPSSSRVWVVVAGVGKTGREEVRVLLLGGGTVG